MEDLVFRDRLAEVMKRLADELGTAATIRRDGTRWTITPAHPGASPLWIWAENAEKLRVTFGRSTACFMIGDNPNIAADQKLAVLETICRTVIAGRLVERRKRPDGSLWRLTFDDGNVLDGGAAGPAGCGGPCPGFGSARSNLPRTPIRPGGPTRPSFRSRSAVLPGGSPARAWARPRPKWARGRPIRVHGLSSTR